MRRFQRKQRQRLVLIGALVAMLVIVSAVIGIAAFKQRSAAVPGGTGQVTFFANQGDVGGETNSLRIAIQNLAAPPAGDSYHAWIIDDATEQVTALGALTQKGQTWTLTFNGGSTDVLTAGDKLEVTQEQGAATAPTGQVVLAGKFPVKSFAHIEHLLVSFPLTPGKIGLLQGVLAQTHLLDNQAALLQNVGASKNTVAIECVAQSMLDIIEGTHGANYKPLAAECNQQYVTITGDGFGLLGKSGYVASVEGHASYALSQPDATLAMRQHTPLMNIALANVNSWLTTMQQDLLALQAHPAGSSSLQQIATLADDAYHGVDANSDGQINPVSGEAGAITAYQQGQLMATLSLAPSP
jgi:hypothetical protein